MSVQPPPPPFSSAFPQSPTHANAPEPRGREALDQVLLHAARCRHHHVHQPVLHQEADRLAEPRRDQIGGVGQKDLGPLVLGVLSDESAVGVWGGGGWIDPFFRTRRRRRHHRPKPPLPPVHPNNPTMRRIGSLDRRARGGVPELLVLVRGHRHVAQPPGAHSLDLRHGLILVVGGFIDLANGLAPSPPPPNPPNQQISIDASESSYIFFLPGRSWWPGSQWS